MSQHLKILKLGWEFPPYSAGGLAPACYGLTKALSRYADITLILPKSDEEFGIENIEIIGLNNSGLKMGVLEKGGDQPRKVVPRRPEMFYDDEIMSSYPLKIEQNVLLKDFFSRSNSSSYQTPLTHEQANDLFNEKELYGTNIMEKVAAYADSVEEIASQREFDIIHAHDWITFPAAIRLKHRFMKPLVVHIHSLETDRVHTQSRNAVYEIERIGMMYADRILPVSNFTKRNIVEHYGIYEDKIYPVYNGIGSESESKRITKNKKHKEKRIVFLGRITAQKGPQYLFETATKLIRKLKHVKIFVAGNGDQKEHLEWLVNSSGLQKHFVFTGFLKKEAVNRLLATADAFIMPSVSEPFGLSALEAAQFDIPCVISKQSGAAEVMSHALQADYWDTNNMANYLYASLQYKHVRKTLTSKTQQMLKHLNWDVAAWRVFKGYCELTYPN